MVKKIPEIMFEKWFFPECMKETIDVFKLAFWVYASNTGYELALRSYKKKFPITEFPSWFLCYTMMCGPERQWNYSWISYMYTYIVSKIRHEFDIAENMNKPLQSWKFEINLVNQKIRMIEGPRYFQIQGAFSVNRARYYIKNQMEILPNYTATLNSAMKVAFAMGTHSRLGNATSLQELNSDIIRKIMKKLERPCLMDNGDFLVD